MDLDDLDFVASMLGDADVMRFWPRRLSRQESRTWITRQQERYQRDGHGYWLALSRETGAPLGQIGVVTCAFDDTREPALGYIIHKPHWRQGLATEGGAACRDWTFNVLGVERAVTLVRPENEPSLGVARTLGYRAERRTMYAGFEHIVLTAARPTGPAP